MSKTRKVLAIAAVLLLVLSLAACGKSDSIYLTLVNKTHELPADWEDQIELIEVTDGVGDTVQVEKETYEHFVELQSALKEEGVDLELDGAYRSVERQQEIWDQFEKEEGLEYTQKYVAVPGTSEHHTGMAVDTCLKIDGKLVYDNDEMLKQTEIWEKVHAKAPEYGFIVRYPKDKEDVTKYSYEPWHLRYVGSPDVAKEIMDQGITLEEYLDEVDE